jgi:REP element-mobilizing transposase RayT
MGKPFHQPSKYTRRSIRLKDYDYSQAGAYFITLSAHNRQCLFGDIVDGAMHLNRIGEIVQSGWLRSENIRSEIELDEFVVMPNHVHGIILICDSVSTQQRAHGRAPLHRKPKSLGSFIAGFKSAATRQMNAHFNTPRRRIWQRNYYEHVIRNEEELSNVRQYIANNPLKWDLDRENPKAQRIEDIEPWEIQNSLKE